MIKKLFFTWAILLFSSLLFAEPVSKDAAKVVATNTYMHYASGISDYSVSNVYETKYNGAITYYTFAFTSGGFVMVSADDAVMPVLGFSTEGTFDPNNIPVNAQEFFDAFNLEISKVVAAHLDNTETKQVWNNYSSNLFTKSVEAVAPMCATSWDQSSPYNNYCPGGSLTGCVATAMAQVMKKWNYPVNYTGTHTYTHATYGSLTAPYAGTAYAWASMTNTYSGASTTAAKNAVARLMYDAGVSVNMNYSPSSSGAYTTDVPPTLIANFGYQPTAQVKNRSTFATDAQWTALIKEELDESRPVMLAGDNAGAAGSGHEFVCDGYNAASLFHINWGWSGSYNGYFGLTALNPGGNNFSSDRAAVIRIVPASGTLPIAAFTASTTIPAIAAPVNFTDNSLNSPTSWLWTFDTGTPATSTLQNPTGVTFATNGYHLVSLKVTNASGSDIITKERYIKVGGAPTVWTKQNSGFAVASRGIDEIEIVDASTVWAKAYDGTNPTGYIREFTRTNNGGTTWNPGAISFTGSNNYGMSNIWPMDYTTCYACMFPITGTGGAIVKTTDGGATWAIQATAPFTGSWADFVHMFDANNGVCVGDPLTPASVSDFVIYTTNNGGTNWNQVSTASLPNTIAGEAGIVNLYDAVGNTIWFSTNKGRIYKSTDKGLTWTVTTTGLSNYFTPRFKNASVGLIVLDTIPYTMKKTNDGGATWSTLVPTGYYVKHAQLAFVPGTASTWVDVASSPSNGSSWSSDDATTFTNVDTGSVQFLSVDMFDINTGWAGSFNLSSTNDGIYKWNNPLATGINNSVATKMDNITVYPVPSKGLINVLLGEVTDENMTVTIYNAVGAVIKSEKMKAISGDIVQYDLSDKDAGLYFITIVNGGKSITKKITIVK